MHLPRATALPPPRGQSGDVRALLRLPGRWSLGVLLVAAVVAAPLLAVLGLALGPDEGVWSHLAGTVLLRYVWATLALGASVGAGVLLIGVSSAWLVTLCRFPGRRMFEWALLLPLAVPAYLAAYAYTELLEYAGPVQTALRTWFGWQGRPDYWFPEVRSLGGAAAFMTLVLYPYVYLLARSAFLSQSASVLEVGRSLGRGPWRTFFTVALPLARPSIVIGVLLALMETLNDFGTVDYFAVPTFTVGIFRVWFGMNSAPAAAQLATLLLGFVVLLVALERLARRSRAFTVSGNERALPGYPLRGWAAFGATTACALPVLLGFVLPVALLGWQAGAAWAPLLAVDFAALASLAVMAGNSLLVSGLAALVCVALGLFLAYAQRLEGSVLVRSANRVASLGYAVPGIVLAVGVIIPAAALDNAVDDLLRRTLGVSSGLLLSGTVAAVTFAYVVRFLPLAFGALEAGLTRITPNMDHAARSLGLSAGETLRRVHVPLLKGSALTAAMLVFVDGMKELPMTLILRPFNFDTLATHVYEFASFESFDRATPAALAIVATGLLPVLVLSRQIARSRPASGAPTQARQRT